MTLTRRKMLGYGALAGLAVPAAMQAHWLSRDFTRPGYSPDIPPAPPGRQIWRNWSGYQVATPEQIYSAASEEELATRIVDWPGRIRPVGSGHSFSALVPSEDMILDTGRLSGLISVDAAAGMATFGAGTRLRQAAMLAAEHGLGFANLPDIDVQTLAGSFSTATHGTGCGLQALHGCITGFRLITADGTARDVTRDSNPDLFDAGRVSLGTLGVITRYTLKLVPDYALNRRLFILPTNEAIARMHDLAAAHRNFEFYVLPNLGYAAVITHDLYQGEIAGRVPSEDEDWIATLKDLRDILGWWPWLRRRAFDAYVALDVPADGVLEDTTDKYWKLLSTARATRMNEMEYHLPEQGAQEAVRAVVAALESRKESFFPMEVRFTGQDDAWLSPFNDGTRVSVAVHKLASEPLDMLFGTVEPILRAYGGRPHWGKLHSLNAPDLAALYPDFDRFAALRARLDPAGKFLNPHIAALFGAEDV